MGIKSIKNIKNKKIGGYIGIVVIGIKSKEKQCDSEMTASVLKQGQNP